MSEYVLAELLRVFDLPYFRRRLPRSDYEDAMRALREQALLTPIIETVAGVATHPEDDLILATSLSARADNLVTGDLKLRRLGRIGGVRIVSPREFLDLIGTQGLM